MNDNHSLIPSYDTNIIHIIITILGYIYVICWCISFYPPIITNYKLKNSNGVSIDFVVLNSFGYICLIECLLLQYYSSDNGNTTTPNNTQQDKMIVTLFDIFYSIHGFILNLILLSQIMNLWPWKFHTGSATAIKGNKQRLNPSYYKLLKICVLIWILITLIYKNTANDSSYITFIKLDLAQYCNILIMGKILMTLIKYIPQIKHNYQRKSMIGFSKITILLDMLGGITSLLQLFLLSLEKVKDSSIMAVLGLNFGKIGISLITITFNSIFLLQFMRYKGNDVLILEKESINFNKKYRMV
ncbi:cystinosin-like protein ERS1 SCDLUD_003745 [Saccharomycodes ludwigii]|nr:hypothetical protein SCDLUD_003745 [Saccharomycodes ludwigii]KAH3900740.1 hypothetical protein SCDLUD_003745 [Saccharomycodes ludwigii]